MPAIANALACFGCNEPICEVCKCCETQDCAFEHRRVVTAVDALAVRYLLAKTQKAKGYVRLANTALNVPKPFYVVMDDSDIDAIGNSSINAFVRPCPMRPRHGFVESEPVKIVEGSSEGPNKIRQIFQAARVADPEAELLIVPYINAKYNVVVTPHHMSIGLGHDGATAGKSTVGFPLAHVMFPELSQALCESAGLNLATEDPYIEAVICEIPHEKWEPRSWMTYGMGTSDSLFVTQLRAGPKIDNAGGGDFIPAPVTVTNIMHAAGDLLEWEQQIQELRTADPGTVVVHIGGSLISHYGVHCVFNGIPIITTRLPEIGEVLEPVGEIAYPDPDAVIQGLGVGASSYIRLRHYESSIKPERDEAILDLSGADAIGFLASVLHNASVMGGHSGYYLGVAVSLMMRLGMAASHGEARHNDPGNLGISRGYIYDRALNEFLESRELLGIAQYRFTKYNWSSSFGGAAWASCTESLIVLDERTRAFLNDPSQENIASMISGLNHTVRCAHNGGWWLNKYVGKETFDDACVQKLRHVLAVAPVAKEIYERSRCNVQDLIIAWRDSSNIQVVEYLGASEDDPPKLAHVVRGEGAAEPSDNDDEPSDIEPCDCPECNPPDTEDDAVDDTPVPPPASSHDLLTYPAFSTQNRNNDYPEIAKLLGSGGPLITHLQGRYMAPLMMKVQYTLEGVAGYFTQVVPINSTQVAHVLAMECTYPSKAMKSDEMYAKFTVGISHIYHSQDGSEILEIPFTLSPGQNT